MNSNYKIQIYNDVLCFVNQNDEKLNQNGPTGIWRVKGFRHIMRMISNNRFGLMGNQDTHLYKVCIVRSRRPSANLRFEIVFVNSGTVKASDSLL